MNFVIKRAFNSLNKRPISKEWKGAQLAIVNHFHSNRCALYNEKKAPSSVILPFNVLENKEKDSFLESIRLYTKDNISDVQYADFIMYAMRYMNEFGVEKDLEVYKALMNVFPKGRYVPTNAYQAIFQHYPKQQVTALELLRKMEENRVIPDYEMQEIILNIFGNRSDPIRKFWRMMYWMPKFLNLNPWPLPSPAPTDPKEVARYAISKISSIDVQAKVTHYSTKDVPDAIEDTWIMSSMSMSQRELLAVQPTDKPLYIEGPFFIWIMDQCIDYFVLKGDPIKREVIYESFDDVSNLKVPFYEKLHNKIPPTVHEQDDGVYYATCATGTSSNDSLLSWIRCLQKTNPVLDKIPIVFKLKSYKEDLTYLQTSEKTEVSKEIVKNTPELKGQN